MNQALEVNELEVRALVSEEKDPYGQDGFFSLTANVLTSDEKKIGLLNSAYAAKSRISVRCCTLEIQGRVTKCSQSPENFKAVMSIDDLRMLKTPH